MRREVTVGLVDSGFEGTNLRAGRAFTWSEQRGVEESAPGPDTLGHGTALASIIVEALPAVHIVSAQIFTGTLSTTPAVVAAALDWLTGEAVDLVNLSFGVRRDRRVLRQSCERARASGLVLVGASPARGAPVYPSAYPGVLRVMGDARCAPGEISHLATPQADYGACPAGGARNGGSRVGGASFAVAHTVSVLARYLESGGEPTRSREYLRTVAKYHGPERRTGNDVER